MTTATREPQTSFEEETITPDVAMQLIEALEEREAADAEFARTDGNVKLMAASLGDGIYRLGGWKLTVETETKTKVRITRPKR